MIIDYRTVLMTGQHSLYPNPNGIMKGQQHVRLNMEYIGSCIQDHFQEVSKAPYSTVLLIYYCI